MQLIFFMILFGFFFAALHSQGKKLGLRLSYESFSQQATIYFEVIMHVADEFLQKTINTPKRLLKH